jgi:hypothetical protein
MKIRYVQKFKVAVLEYDKNQVPYQTGWKNPDFVHDQYFAMLGALPLILTQAMFLAKKQMSNLKATPPGSSALNQLVKKEVSKATRAAKKLALARSKVSHINSQLLFCNMSLGKLGSCSDCQETS